MSATGEQPRATLQRIARRVMVERGLLPDFSAEALTELGRIQPLASPNGGQVRDLRNEWHLNFCKCLWIKRM